MVEHSSVQHLAQDLMAGRLSRREFIRHGWARLGPAGPGSGPAPARLGPGSEPSEAPPNSHVPHSHILPPNPAPHSPMASCVTNLRIIDPL